MKTLFAFSMGLMLPLLQAGRADADTTGVVAIDTVPVIRAGQPAPDFKLLNQAFVPVALSDFQGKWVVLYFYPKDFSQGCTLEAHNFQRDIQKYEAANAVILGVSVDSVYSHKDFCSKEGLSFKLLADTNAFVSSRYGSLHDWYGHKRSARNTFLIDPYGIVAKIFIGVEPGLHSEEVLKALAELQK